MIKRNLFFLFFLLTFQVTQAQQFKSIHQEESENYSLLGISASEYYNINQGLVVPKTKTIKNCTLNKIVFGWHPYWNNGLEVNYEWSLISDLSYFAYEVNPSTGAAVSTHGWDTVSVVTTALSNGVRVNLCVTMFSNHAVFFGSATARQTLITNLINRVQQRGAHGVNIDFELVPSANKNDLTNFMVDLCTQMHAAIPGSQVSMAIPAVDWSNTFDVAAMAGHVDLFLIMGYDYYYNGSAQAGPTDPLYTHVSTYNYNISKSVTYYLNKGIPNAKLALGLPYYGREWPTVSNTVPSNTITSGVSRTFKYVKTNANNNYSNPVNYNKTMSTYHIFQDTDWRQCFITDAHMMGRRYDFVNMRNLAGIGIWALGNDDGFNDLWDVIENKFTNCAQVPCSDTIYDMGGPLGNYYNNENYTFTIAPNGATSVSLVFNSFNLTAGADTLKIYDGHSINAPLIGSFTGSSSPGTVNSTGNAITLSFKSGNGITASGWEAVWICSGDTIPPETHVLTSNIWVNDDFIAHFNDTDNVGGSGIGRRFYQAASYSGTSWETNTARGFLSDNFQSLNTQVWTVAPNGGTWAVNANVLTQTNETNSNTNIYAAVDQTLSNRYLYHFKAKINGTDNNKRFGFHFFCDSASYSNRNNSYFIWFREASSVLELYKVVNNTFSIIKTIPNVATNLNQWYDIKVIYDRITGEIMVYRDNILLGAHTDANPYSTGGNYVSFRSGNCQLFIDSLDIYRTRTATPVILVGNSPLKDMQYESPDLQTKAGKIKSIVADNANNLSGIATAEIYIDYSPPTPIDWLNDGLGPDIDTTFSANELSANWASSADINTGITAYWYAIGTFAGDTSILSWTNNGLNLSVTHSGLNLIHNTIYYFSVKAENGAGFFNQTISSNGQIVILNSSVVALFDWSNDSVCSGNSVNFSNNSSNALLYEWVFQGGQPPFSIDNNPEVVYDTPGAYMVQLIAHGSSTSDTLTLPSLIHVFQNPTAGFTAPDTVCMPFAIVAFQNTSINALNYLWDFGDSITSADFSPWHIYDSAGFYKVTLIAYNEGCSDIYSKPIVVINCNSTEQLGKAFLTHVFPNPFSDELRIALNLYKPSAIEIYVTNIHGQTVFAQNQTYLDAGSHLLNIGKELASAVEGMYFLQLKVNEVIVNYKVLKL